MQFDIWHNILWSSYKGAVFSELDRIAGERDITVRFFQIAETDRQRKTFTEPDVHYHRYPYELMFRGSYDRVPRFMLCWKLVKYVVLSPADIIILAGYHRLEYWLQLAAGRLMGKKMAVFCDLTAYEHKRTLLKSISKGIFFGLCYRVFCYGHRAAAYVASFGISPERIVLRCQAAALPDNYSVQSALKRRLALTANRSEPCYVYIGRLSAEKNLDILLKSFAKVRASIPAARLRIVGSGPQMDELRALARSLSVDTQVEFPGSMSGQALYDEYSSATCLILPSRSEPWGLVVNEALAYGCPVIVSDRCGCVPELVVDRETGYVVRCGDVDDLADKMMRTIEDFRDVQRTADACITQIGPFSPSAAGRQILDGLSWIGPLVH